MFFSFFLMLCFSPEPASAKTVKIFVSTVGKDKNHGRTIDQAILSLDRANEIVGKLLKSDPSHVVVEVAPGVYKGQSVVWTATHPDFQVIIRGALGKGKPVFDGLGTQAKFFHLKAKSGERTNVGLHRLRVKNYLEAVILGGDREDFDRGFNSHNSILNCEFEKIGGKYQKDHSKLAYAVVRLVNSRHNTIRLNSFKYIENASRPLLLHSLYLAHNSKNNLVERNTFYAQTGDPVRLRDFSNKNQIRNNQFTAAGQFAYSDWFCDPRKDRCTKREPECPSWENLFTENTVRGSRVFNYYINGNGGCQREVPAGYRRLRTSSNIVAN